MIKRLRGMKDILPEEVLLWQYIEKAAKDLFALFGYGEIRTPILEEGSLFTKSIGESTDIVQKEMYAFKDKGGRHVSMRPEGTAPIVRAYIENNLDKAESLTKLYYIGPMFRSERPQAGRQRQFSQIGVEAIGSDSPYIDAEVIALIKLYLERIGLSGYTIKINTLGCSKDKTNIRKALQKFLKDKTNLLCKDCKARYKKNILRIFDCKEDGCKAVLRTAPKIIDNICSDCKDHFDNVKNALDALKVPYSVDPYIVRGLDYYTRTAFEVTHPNLGAQDAIGAGGRYDNLVRDTGGPKAGACGFALGQDRLILALGKEGSALPALGVYIAVLGEEARREGFRLCNELRSNGVSSQMDYQERSLKAQMRQANKKGSKYVAIIGEDELQKGIIVLRDMSNGTQKEIKKDSFVEEAKKALC
ncbi:MAG: histidine--tRNA ligase [Candidatus Omnitrophica bacterium]|nr:histidine--tRNA ligase [Candidatus Omnitrophota bacterium]